MLKPKWRTGALPDAGHLNVCSKKLERVCRYPGDKTQFFIVEQKQGRYLSRRGREARDKEDCSGRLVVVRPRPNTLL